MWVGCSVVCSLHQYSDARQWWKNFRERAVANPSLTSPVHGTFLKHRLCSVAIYIGHTSSSEQHSGRCVCTCSIFVANIRARLSLSLLHQYFYFSFPGRARGQTERVTHARGRIYYNIYTGLQSSSALIKFRALASVQPENFCF